MDTEKSIEEAFSAINNNDKSTARKILSQVIQVDPKNEQAWILFSYVAEKREQSIYCLERALQINPKNQLAKAKLNDVLNAPSDPNTPSFIMASIKPREVLDQSRPQEISRVKIHFQPRYITFIGGLIAGFSVLLVWEEVVRHTEGGTFTQSTSRGIESVQGLIILLGAIALCVTSLIHKTKPQRPSSPYSILIGMFLLIITYQNITDAPSYIGEYLTFLARGDPYTSVQIGDGIYWTMLGLGLAIFGAMGINPGSGRPNWTSYLALGVQWILAILPVILGGILGFSPFLNLVCGLPLGLFALFSTITVIRGRQRALINRD